MEECNSINITHDDLLKEMGIESSNPFIEVKINDVIINNKLNDLTSQLNEINELIIFNGAFSEIETINDDELDFNKIMQYVDMEKSLPIKLHILKEYKKVISDKADDKLKKYLNYQNEIKKWEYEKAIILGEIQEPGVFDSIKKYEEELEYIKNTLPGELNAKLNNRTKIMVSIFWLYLEELKVLEEIYSPFSYKTVPSTIVMTTSEDTALCRTAVAGV